MTKSKPTSKESIATPDARTMRQTKDLFLPGKKISVRLIPESPKRKERTKTTKFLYGTLHKLSKALIEANKKGYLVAVIPHATTGRGTDAKNVTDIKCVFADIDSKLDKKALCKLSIPPHLIFETSPNRGVAMWRVADCDLAMFPKIQMALAKKLGADMSRISPSSMFRLPGTLHWKGQPFQSRILHIDEKATPLKVSKLAKSLKLDLEEEAHDIPLTSKARDSEVTPDEIKSALDAIPVEVLNERDSWLKIGKAVHSAMPDQAGLDLFTIASRKSPKFEVKELQRQWQSFKTKPGGTSIGTLFHIAQQHGWRNPTQHKSGLPRSELKLVDYVAQQLRSTVRYDYSKEAWLYFDGVAFLEHEEKRKVKDCLRKIVQDGQQAARDAGDTEAIALFTKYANPTGLVVLLKNCEHHKEVNIEHEKLNANPNLFAVANGVIDLATGSLRPGKLEDMITRRSPVVYDKFATAPLFEKFLKDATGNDEEFIKYLQVHTGYFLVGESTAQLLPVVKGRGGSGKGVYTRALKSIMGPYSTAVPPNLLTSAYAGNANGPSPALMVLDGPRLYVCSEGMENRKFDSAFLKQISGGDEFSGRNTYGSQVVFCPTGKLLLTTNTLPHIDSNDDAMWRRFAIIPFDRKPKARDDHLSNKLLAEAPGILNWALKGAKQYLKSGLMTCKQVEKATRAARISGDTVGNWLKECCKVKEGGKIKSSDAYASYKKLCQLNGQHPLSPQLFPAAVEAKGFVHHKGNSFNSYRGITLRD